MTTRTTTMPTTSLLVMMTMMIVIMIAHKKISRTTTYFIESPDVPTVNAFTVSTKHTSGQQRKSSNIPLCAVTTSSTTTNNKPKRLTQNVDGVVYVNDRCIDCAACAGFADNIFRHDRNAGAHVVYQQPQTTLDIAMTRAALAACPVAAIRIETVAERRHRAAVNAIHSNEKDANVSPDEAKKQFDIEWDEQDIWTVQQMTSKENERPFPRPFLLFNDSDLAVTDSSLSTIATTTTTTMTSTHTTGTAVPDVYWVGHHNERSFGAIPYLLKARHNNNDDIWIMVDVPKFNVQAVRDVTSITGPNGPHYLFMTHVDDTADHLLWAEYFNSTTTKYCQRIFHASDSGRYNWIGDTSLEHVPILLQEAANSKHRNGALVAYTLDGTHIDNENWVHDFENGLLLNNTDVVIVHTPGHSPGSCTLYKRRTVPSNASTTKTTLSSSPGILFTGDTYAYSRTNCRMTGFPRYGRNMHLLNSTLHSLVYELNAWDIIAPGHGTYRDYRTVSKEVMYQELQQAQHDLFVYQRR